MTSPISRAAVVVCAAALALPAQADNRSRVEAFTLPDGTFEVVARFSEDALYWCGASVAATTVASGGQRIYVLSGPAPSRAVPGKTAVRFGLTPPVGRGAANSFSNSVDVVGNSLTLVQARQTCNERSASG